MVPRLAARRYLGYLHVIFYLAFTVGGSGTVDAGTGSALTADKLSYGHALQVDASGGQEADATHKHPLPRRLLLGQASVQAVRHA